MKQRWQSDGFGFVRELLEWLKAVTVALLIVLFLHRFVFYLSVVEGSSMEPTLKDGERVFVNRIVYRLGEPKRGDVVILESPDSMAPLGKFLVKRVIAVPGDTVEIHGKKLYVNGEPVHEPYTAGMIEDGDFGPVTVPENHYFVMGDNRRAGGSADSRTFGPVAKERIEGQAEFIIWPIADIGGL